MPRSNMTPEKLALLKECLDTPGSLRKGVYIILSGQCVTAKLLSICPLDGKGKKYIFSVMRYNNQYSIDHVYLTARSCNAAIASKYRWLRDKKATFDTFQKVLNYVHS